MAKPVITIANSFRNIRITYVPLLTAIDNAVGIFLSQPYHADKVLKLLTTIILHFTAYMGFPRLFGLDWTFILICNSFKFSDLLLIMHKLLMDHCFFNNVNNQKMTFKKLFSLRRSRFSNLNCFHDLNKIVTNYKGS